MGDEVYIPTKETFQGYSDSSKLDTLFDISVATLLSQGRMDDRVCKLEDQKWFNRGISAGTGFVSGIATILAALKFRLFE